MFRKSAKYFCSSRHLDLVQAANKQRKAMIEKIYRAVEDEKDFTNKVKLMQSGQLWLKHAELEARPKIISHEVTKRLEDLDNLISRNQVIRQNFLENEIWWTFF